MNKIIVYSLMLFVFLSSSFCFAERVFFEDCEDTTFTEWFLERSIGSSDGYWESETIVELTRSTTSPYSGLYSMTYDPWTTQNPHTNVGEPSENGNTSGWLITAMDTDIYYFRWRQRWETGISYAGSAQNKNLYIGYSTYGGDFVCAVEKGGPTYWHVTIRSNPGYVIRENYEDINSAESVDDNEWHKMEVYIDLGTTGETGTFRMTVDDVVLKNDTSVYYRGAININEGSALNSLSWPSNTSGTSYTGTNNQWLDDLEIWDSLPTADTAPVVSVNSSGTTVYTETSITVTGTASASSGRAISTISTDPVTSVTYTPGTQVVGYSFPTGALSVGLNTFVITAEDNTAETGQGVYTVTYVSTNEACTEVGGSDSTTNLDPANDSVTIN